jgi:hypothetical protein
MAADALVLDFGGVISRTVFETHRENERALGLAPGTLRWMGPFDPDSDPLWRSMQAGEVSERDVDAWTMVFRAGHWYLVGHDRERDGAEQQREAGGGRIGHGSSAVTAAPTSAALRLRRRRATASWCGTPGDGRSTATRRDRREHNCRANRRRT